MNTDVAISYKAKLIEIDNKIREIEKIGFDVTKIREELDNIKVENDDNIKKSKTMSFEGIIINDYINAISKLEILESKLDNYAIYVRVYYYTNYLNIVNITNENLNEIITEIKLLLRKIRNSSVVDYEDEKHIVESFYKNVLKVIFKEIKLNQKSELLEFCKNNNNDIAFISLMIEEYIKNLDLTKYPEIELAYYRAKKNSSIANLLNDTFLKEIVFRDEKDKLKNDIIVSNNKLISDIASIEQEVKKRYQDYSVIEKRYQKGIKLVKLEFKNLLKSIVSFAIVLSIPVASFNLLNFIGKHLYKEYTYDFSIDKYCSFDNTFMHSDERNKLYIDTKNAYVIKYDLLTDEDIKKYNDYYGMQINNDNAIWYRKKSIYDLSYLKYQNINDYLDYWNSNAKVPISSSKIINIKGKDDVIQEYVDYYDLIYNTIDLESKHAEVSDASWVLALFISGFVAAGDILILVMELGYEPESRLNVIRNFKKYLQEKENFKNNKKLYFEQAKQLLILIGQNEKLRELFNIEAAKYGELFKQIGIKLPEKTLDSSIKKQLMEGGKNKHRRRN